MFITNGAFYFFDVKCQVDTTKLVNCIIHDSEAAMYNHVSEETGLQLDEIQGNNIGVRASKHEGAIQTCDGRGIWASFKVTSLEYWLSNYVM